MNSKFFCSKARREKSFFAVIGSKGFAFSLDSLLALVLLLGLVVFSTSVSLRIEAENPRIQNQTIEDALLSIENSGFLLQSLDEQGSLQDASNAVYLKLKNLLPSNYDLNVSVKKYLLDVEKCRQSKNFQDCFPEGNLQESSSGTAVPLSASVLSKRKLFLKKQNPGSCVINPEIEFSAPETRKSFAGQDFAGLLKNFFLKSNKAFFENELIIDVFVSRVSNGSIVSNGDTILCDEALRVDLNTGFNTVGREPINMIFGGDASNTTGECEIAKGNVIDSNSGTLSSSFQKVHEFVLTDNNAFDVLLDWHIACSTNCPEFYLVAPNNAVYGSSNFSAFDSNTNYNSNNCDEPNSPQTKVYYQGIPLVASFAYLAVGESVSGLSKTGTWQVYAKSATPYSFDLQIKKINTFHFNDSTGLVEVWRNPVSKIEVEQTIMERFRLLPDWNSGADEYAFEKIGRDNSSASSGTKLRPSSGLRPINDNALSGFLSGFDIYSHNESAFGYALDGSNLINDTLEDEPPSELRISLLIGDYDSNGSPSVVSAAEASRDLKVIVFTIGVGRDKNFTDLKLIAGITGGSYYNATDENSLDDIIFLIKQKIIALASDKPGVGAPDLNLHIPIAPGSAVSNVTTTFQGTYELTDTDLSFYVKDINILSLWRGSYNLVFPCNSDFACDANSRTIPETGTDYNWTDGNGINYLNVLFDTNKQIEVSFLYRDLNVDFSYAELMDVNNLYVELQVNNIGYLSTVSDPTIVNLYLNKPGTPESSLLDSLRFKHLCGKLDGTCSTPDWYDQNNTSLFSEGTIYAQIDENIARDCPAGNQSFIVCTSGGAAEFYVVDYHVWRK